MDNEINEVLNDIEFLRNVYTKLITLLPAFDVTDKSVLPYGLKPHTRSVSWLVEQVITQQTKYHKKELGLDDVDFNMPDTSLHDCVIHVGKKNYFVNVKIHNTGGQENKNDIAAVEKLYMQYAANPSYNLIYACFGISFTGIRINFSKNYLEIFSPQFLPIYVNPRNDKIQAFYKHEPQIRTRTEFLEELKKNSKSIILK
ncbi:MAG: hypothetical protein QXT94_00450 [Methanothrix sp.]